MLISYFNDSSTTVVDRKRGGRHCWHDVITLGAPFDSRAFRESCGVRSLLTQAEDSRYRSSSMVSDLPSCSIADS
jgi:hypothetical protein